MQIKNKKGFTLVELMTVIAMIGILSAVVVVSTISAQKRAKDNQRIQDLKLVQTYLERFYANYGRYPISDYDGDGGWDVGNSNKVFIPELATFIGSTLPVDKEKSGTNSGYFYYRYNQADSASYGCPDSKTFYVLKANVDDASSVSASPGWSCSLRNWQSAGFWVTGKYE